MSNKAVLVISFGSSFDSARKEIENAEQAIAEKLDGYKLYTAFTSGMIRNKLKKNGVEIMSPEEAVDAAIADGTEYLIVQPTHLLYGDEYDKLCRAVENKRDNFKQVVIGKPLLADYNDIERVLGAIDSEIPHDEDEAVVLMGHGTEHFCNTVYAAADFFAKARGFNNFFIGTVEAWPDIDNVIDDLKMNGVKRCVLVPFMLVAGDHANNDMAGDDEDSWKSLIEASGISARCVVSGLGNLKSVCDIYAEHAVKAAGEFDI